MLILCTSNCFSLTLMTSLWSLSTTPNSLVSPGREPHLIPQHQLHNQKSSAASLFSVKAKKKRLLNTKLLDWQPHMLRMLLVLYLVLVVCCLVLVTIVLFVQWLRWIVFIFSVLKWFTFLPQTTLWSSCFICFNNKCSLHRWNHLFIICLLIKQSI